MSLPVAEETAETLWEKCLKVDHECADLSGIISLYKATHVALLKEIDTHRPGHKCQGLVQRHDILCAWADEVGLALS